MLNNRKFAFNTNETRFGIQRAGSQFQLVPSRTYQHSRASLLFTFTTQWVRALCPFLSPSVETTAKFFPRPLLEFLLFLHLSLLSPQLIFFIDSIDHLAFFRGHESVSAGQFFLFHVPGVTPGGRGRRLQQEDGTGQSKQGHVRHGPQRVGKRVVLCRHKVGPAIVTHFRGQTEYVPACFRKLFERFVFGFGLAGRQNFVAFDYFALV